MLSLTEAADLAGRGHLDAERGVSAAQAVEGEHRCFDRDEVLGAWAAAADHRVCENPATARVSTAHMIYALCTGVL